MSSDLFIGLFCQLAAVVLVLRRTRGRWFSHVGVLFILVAFTCHGVSEIVQMLFPGRNFYRTLVSQDDVDAWVAIVGVAMLLFACVYCLTLGNARRPIYDPAHLAHWAKRYLPDWRLMLVLAMLGFWVNVSGQDFGYWINGLSTYLISLAIVTLSVALVFKSGPHTLFPVLLMQVVLSSLLDSRIAVVVNAVVLLSVMGRFEVPIRRRQIALLGGIGIVLMVLISSARVAGGRVGENTESADVAARAKWLMGGFDVLTDPAILGSSVADDFVYRFDCNAFNGMVHRKLAEGYPPAGIQSFWNNFVLMVPSFLNPTKTSDYDAIDLSEEGYAVVHYGLSEQVDFIPGTLGIIHSYYGSYGLWIIMILLGWMYARIDGWLAGTRTTWAFLMGLGFISASILMDSAVVGYFNTFRSLIAFYAFSQGVVWGQRLLCGEKQPRGNKLSLMPSAPRTPAYRPE